jgi:hypothetical protein
LPDVLVCTTWLDARTSTASEIPPGVSVALIRRRVADVDRVIGRDEFLEALQLYGQGVLPDLDCLE